MRTSELIYEMLTENTGVHMCDSGMGSNRHWQKNQGKTFEDFENEPEESITFDPKFKELYRRVSVYHYLSELTQDEICRDFNAMNTSSDWEGEYYGTSKKAADFIDSLEDFEFVNDWNTYNGDSDLSQVVQGTTFKTSEDEYYFLIQIHGGADVRGGYTDAKLFKGFDYNDGVIHSYLSEYKDSYELEQDLEYFCDTIADENDETKTYTSEEVLAIINE